MNKLFLIIVSFSIILAFKLRDPLVPTTQMNSVGQAPTEELLELDVNDPLLHWASGMMYYKEKAFTGFLLEHYESDTLKSRTEYAHGKRNGSFLSWYPNGNPAEDRHYLAGEKDGVHKGWHTNGNPKFVYQFKHGQTHGLQREWYDTGEAYRTADFEHGREIQVKLLRKNGKVLSNYVVKNGRRYGLLGTKACYSVNEKK